MTKVVGVEVCSIRPVIFRVVNSDGTGETFDMSSDDGLQKLGHLLPHLGLTQISDARELIGRQYV